MMTDELRVKHDEVKRAIADNIVLETEMDAIEQAEDWQIEKMDKLESQGIIADSTELDRLADAWSEKYRELHENNLKIVKFLSLETDLPLREAHDLYIRQREQVIGLILSLEF